MGRLIAFGGRCPRIAETAFVAPTAVVIGNVSIGAEASVWFGAVLRGDHPENGIRVGARANVQENAVIHTSEQAPTVIEEEVTVGHGAIMESCRVGRGAVVPFVLDRSEQRHRAAARPGSGRGHTASARRARPEHDAPSGGAA